MWEYLHRIIQNLPPLDEGAYRGKGEGDRDIPNGDGVGRGGF